MKKKQVWFPIIGGAAGLALFLIGVWCSGWTWHRGADAVFLYVCAWATAGLGVLAGAVTVME